MGGMSAAIVQHIRRSPAPKLALARAAADAVLPAAEMDAAWSAITRWTGYAPTPLHALPDAAHYGVGAIHYKDEAPRFGLNSFKALGGAYALERLLAEHVRGGGSAADYTVATATDGNHGKSVAWGAQRAGCRAKIFVHREVSDARINAIAMHGAEVIRIDGDYDDSVRECKAQADAHGWQIISDTSWAGYTAPPQLVMAGYTVLMRETLQQLDAMGNARPTHVIMQAGVGALAAALCAALLPAVDALPRIVIVETAYADCLLQSAAADKMTSTPIRQETIMAGLSCGEPSLLAWQVLAAAASDFVSINDDGVGEALRALAAHDIVAGECSAAGLAVLAAARDGGRDAGLYRDLGLGRESVVLMFGSEGATDADAVRRLLHGDDGGGGDA